MVAEDYIHRIGRTGRAGATGVAISLVGPDDWAKLAGIERLTGRRLEREVIPGLEPKRPEPRATQGKAANKRSWQGKKGYGRGKSASGYSGNGRPTVSYRSNGKPGPRSRRPSQRSRSVA